MGMKSGKAICVRHHLSESATIKNTQTLSCCLQTADTGLETVVVTTDLPVFYFVHYTSVLTLLSSTETSGCEHTCTSLAS